METFYANGTYYYKDQLPKTLCPYVGYIFSNGPYIGNDFKSFNTKLKNAVKKLLPDGYQIHKWMRGHYEASAVVTTPDGKYIYLSFDDVRFFPNEWFTNILYRTMEHEKDWKGGSNHFTSLFTLTEDIQKLYG